MGDHVRRFYELGTPEAAPSALIGLRRLAAQAVHYALWPTPGPVHVNARARKPLDPTVAATAAGEALEVRVDELIARPIVAAPPPIVHPDLGAVERAAAVCRETERGLIVCGPAPLRQRRLRDAVDRLLLALEQLERAIGTTASAASEWSDAFGEADRRAWAVVDAEVENGDDSFSEGTAVRTVLERVPHGSLLMLGNSLAVREVDTFCRP